MAETHGAPACRLPSKPAGRPGGRGARAAGMGVTPSFRRCPVTARPRPRPQARTPAPAALPSAGRALPAFPAGTACPLFLHRTRTRALPDGAARAGRPPNPETRAPRLPGNPKARCRHGPEKAGGGGKDSAAEMPLPRGASGPALTSASPPGRWQHCAGSPRRPDRGTRLTSARRRRSVGYPRKWEGPGIQQRRIRSLISTSLLAQSPIAHAPANAARPFLAEPLTSFSDGCICATAANGCLQSAPINISFDPATLLSTLLSEKTAGSDLPETTLQWMARYSAGPPWRER